jgi:uncharacterized OB-fold protein
MATRKSADTETACQHCGALVFPDARRCNQCGKFPVKLHRCPKCGMISEPTCERCPRCGRLLDPDGDYL